MRIVYSRPLSPKVQLHTLLDNNSIHKRFPSQNAGFTSMRVFFEVPEPIEAHWCGDHPSD